MTRVCSRSCVVRLRLCPERSSTGSCGHAPPRVVEHLHHGRHVATEGPDAGAFPVNRIDADAAISLVRVMFSYISRALAVANAAAD